jgi:hypothetical protein
VDFFGYIDKTNPENDYAFSNYFQIGIMPIYKNKVIGSLSASVRCANQWLSTF